MRKKAIYAGLMAAGLVMLPTWGQAAGLGKLTVMSALGQPLQAEAEILTDKKENPDDFVVKLASADAYSQANMDWSPALASLRFSIGKKAGKPVLLINSTQAINEPYLPILVEMQWPTGMVVRDFTVLLDPPGYNANAAAAAPSVSLPKSTAVSVAPVAKPPVQSPVSAAPAPAAKASAKKTPAADSSSGETQSPQSVTVKPGDTLSSIARKVKPEGVQLEQMLVGLFQENTSAFSGKNMNRLRTGQILRVPDQAALEQISPTAARKEIKVQSDNWHAYRQQLAGTVEQGKAEADSGARQAVSGKIGLAAEDKAAPKPQPSQDVLKLSKGEPVKGAVGGGKDSKALQDKIQAMSEDATAREKTIKEANSRIAALEKNIQDMQKAMQLKDQQLAEMQKQGAKSVAPVPAPVAAAKPAVPASAPVAVAASAVAASTVAAAPASAPAASAVAASATKPASAVAATKPKKKKVIMPPPEPEEQPWYADLLDNPLTVFGGGGALALLLGGWGYMAVKRRRKKLTSFEDSIMAGSELKANTVLGETSGGTVDTSNDTSFLTNFSQTGFNAIDTNDVDPIAEAEVYMAYGRDAQAEEILKEAMAKTPERHEIQLKLLEIYSSRKNLVAFETLASELYAALGGKTNALWEKAAAMGRQLDPANPLYASRGDEFSAAEEPAPSSAPVQAAATAAAAVAVAALEPVTDLALPELGSTGADESLSEEPAPSEPDVLEFDLGLPETEHAAGVSGETASTGETMAEASLPDFEHANMLDLDLGLPEPATAAAEPAEDVAMAESLEETVSPADSMDLDFELPAAEEIAPLEMPEAAAVAPDLDLELPSFESGLSESVSEAIPEFNVEEPSLEAMPEISTGEAALDLGLPDLQPAAAPVEVEEVAMPAVTEEPDLNFDFDTEFKVGDVMEASPAAEAPEAADEFADLAAEPAMPAAMESSAEDMLIDTAQNPGTKLDLAKAYLEIGDEEGAREILQEVIAEGNDAQKAEANTMLEKIG